MLVAAAAASNASGFRRAVLNACDSLPTFGTMGSLRCEPSVCVMVDRDMKNLLVNETCRNSSTEFSGVLCMNGGGFGVDRRFRRLTLIQNLLGACYFIWCSVGDQEELARLHPGLVLHDAVLRNADAGQCGTEGTEPADYDGAFERANDPRHQRSRDDHRTNDWQPKERRAEQHAPETAPKRSQLAPVLHPLANVVVADDVLFRLVIPADDRELLHVEATPLKFTDGLFRLIMGFKYGDNGVRFGHDFVSHNSPFKGFGNTYRARQLPRVLFPLVREQIRR